MRIVDCEQRSPEWIEARRGLPTASDFGRIITPAKMQYAAAAQGYINELIDSVCRPDVADAFGGNRHTERGNCLEGEALDVYAFERDVTLRRVGLVLSDDGKIGASPDALVAIDKPVHFIRADRLGLDGSESYPPEAGPPPFAGGCEVKCPDGKTHIAWLRAGVLPDEHKAQVHGGLLVTGLPWWDFISYCPPYPLLVVRVVPDKFTAALGECLQKFLAEYAKERKAIEEAIA